METVQKAILKLCGTVTVSLPAGRFVAREHFKVDTGNEAEVKISDLGDNFQEWFLDNSEKQAGGESTLRIQTLRRDSVDEPIIADLGGHAMARTSLAEIFALMKKQGKGKTGALLTNGYANIFYVRDVKRVLRAVYVSWRDDGWRVIAYSVADPDEWRAGLQVFSRNS